MRNRFTRWLGLALDGFRPAVHDMEDVAITVGVGLVVALIGLPALVWIMRGLFGG